MRLLFTLFVLILSACSHLPTVSERTDEARHLALQSGWVASEINTRFAFVAFMPEEVQKTERLTIYIEGDGLAWLNQSTPSSNPTPINPLALKLALQDPDSAVYLGRVCQYLEQQSGCDKRYWTSARFAPEVIDATSQAVDQLKTRFGADEIVLVGYSGGGAIAALVAARRHDVVELITVAGNLDHRFWTKEHKVTPLSESLNPADVWKMLVDIPQTHYIGSEDRVISMANLRAYADRFPADSVLRVVVVPDFDHHCCWSEQWPQMK